jgi:hypothetical protein
MSNVEHRRNLARMAALAQAWEPWTATDSLVKELAPRWLRHAGIDHFGLDLEQLGPCDDQRTQLEAVGVLARATLTADIAAVGVVSMALSGRDHDARARLVTALGRLSGSSWQQIDASVDKLVTKSSEEQHIATSLVQGTREVISHRQTKHEFAAWVSRRPDGFARFAWSAALRAAGERLWDRNWSKIASLIGPQGEPGIRPLPPTIPQRGWLTLGQSAAVARKAAVDRLVTAALSNDPEVKATAWDDAVEAAYYTRGAETWSADAFAIRTRVGEARWATANRSARGTVRVVINELPYVVGRIGMIALAAEACTAAARAIAVRAGAEAMIGIHDVDAAVRAANASMSQAVVPIVAA